MRELRLGWRLLDDARGHGNGFPIPEHLDGHRRIHRYLRHFATQVIEIPHGFLVEFLDDVAGQDGRLFRRRTRHDAIDHHPYRRAHPEFPCVFRRERTLDAEIPVKHVAEPQNVIQRPAHGGGGNREADPLKAAVVRDDGVVDADEFATHVDERAAAVAFG